MTTVTVLAWGPEAERAAAAMPPSVDVWLCSSADEVHAQLRGPRSWSVVLLDASLPETDRDLVLACARHGSQVVVIDARSRADWVAMGASVVASAREATDQLVVDLSDRLPSHEPTSEEAPGALIAVTGPGGTGASTTAVALAQGLSPKSAPVVLVDLVRNAEQHVLHGLAPDAPGIADLVEAHRSREPSAEALRSAATPVAGRGYQVIGGLRRAVAWSALQPAAVAATLHNLRRAYRAVVADVDADLEGEADTGSPDVEERNAMARQSFATADVGVVVVRPGLKGTHAALRVLTNVWNHGMDPERTVAASIGGREDDIFGLQDGFRRLGAGSCRAVALPAVETEALLVHGLPLPDVLVAAVSETVVPLLTNRLATREQAYERVQPGSLGLSAEPRLKAD